MGKRFSAVAALVLCFCLLAPAFATAQQKIGFVDLSKALELTDKGKGIQKDLAAQRDEIEIKVKEMELNLLNMKDEYNKKKDGLAPEALRQLERQMQQVHMEYQAFVQGGSIEFEKFKLKLLKKFITEMEGHASKIAEAEGYGIVILKVEDYLTGSSVVLYGSSSVDLTDKVIKKLNETPAG